jgi:hypothetical protein
LAEVTVFAADTAGKSTAFVGGVEDAMALSEDSKIDFVVDGKVTSLQGRRP